MPKQTVGFFFLFLFFFTLRAFIGTEMNPVSRVYLCGQLILCTLHLIKICERVTVVRTFHPEILTPACGFNPPVRQKAQCLFCSVVSVDDDPAPPALRSGPALLVPEEPVQTDRGSSPLDSLPHLLSVGRLDQIRSAEIHFVCFHCCT